MNKLLFILLVFSLIACSSERQVVKQLNRELDSMLFLVRVPDELLLTNSKHYAWENRNLTNDELQFLKFSQSRFIQFLNSEEILKDFETNLVMQFTPSGLKVLKQDEVTTFINSKSNAAYIIDIKQLEAEEFFREWQDNEVFDDTNLYYQDYLLNAFAINLWAEITKSSNTKLKTDLIFIQNEDFDRSNGIFTQNIFTNEVAYSNLYDSLKLVDVERLIQSSPYYFANEILDFIINREIQERLSAKEIYEVGFRYSYSSKKKRILPSVQTSNYVLMKSSN